MDDKKVLDAFGRHLIESSRDGSIEEFDLIASGKMKSVEAKYFYEELSKIDPINHPFIRTLIVSMVDRTLHNFLSMVEEEEDIDIVFVNGNDRISLKKISDGLAGELFSENGWISKFSEYK